MIIHFLIEIFFLIPANAFNVQLRLKNFVFSKLRLIKVLKKSIDRKQSGSLSQLFKIKKNPDVIYIFFILSCLDH